MIAMNTWTLQPYATILQLGCAVLDMQLSTLFFKEAIELLIHGFEYFRKKLNIAQL